MLCVDLLWVRFSYLPAEFFGWITDLAPIELWLALHVWDWFDQ